MCDLCEGIFFFVSFSFFGNTMERVVRVVVELGVIRIVVKMEEDGGERTDRVIN